MSKSAKKLRRVYKRFGTPVVCYDGQHFAPAEGAESGIPKDARVKAALVDDAVPAAINIFRPIPKKKGTRETWRQIELKKKSAPRE